MNSLISTNILALEGGITDWFGGVSGGSDVWDKVTAYINIIIGIISLVVLVVASIKTAAMYRNLKADPETQTVSIGIAVKKVLPYWIGVLFTVGTFAIGSIMFAIMKTFFGTSGVSSSNALANWYGKFNSLDAGITSQVSGWLNIALIWLTLFAYWTALINTALQWKNIHKENDSLEPEDSFKQALKRVMPYWIGFGIAMGSFIIIGMIVSVISLFLK